MVAALVAVASGSVVGVPPARAEDDALDVRRISPEQRRRVLRGEVISYTVPEGSERDLTVGLAMFVPVPPGTLAPSLGGGELIERDPGIAAFAQISEATGPASFAAVRFGSGEAAEARALLDAEPGFRFNLSTRELGALHALRNEVGPGGGAAMLETVSRVYRRLLFERWHAYRTSGLDGLAPYARRGAVTDPAAELRGGSADARVIAHLVPRLGEALQRYPMVPLAHASHFYWIRRLLQGRPAVALLHVITDARPDLILYVERHFYVGHSYNVSQTISGAVPFEGGSLIFATSRVSTDQVTGLGGELKRTIGRRQLRGEILDRFERIRAFVAKPERQPERQESP
jgi:hypothetical protein